MWAMRVTIIAEQIKYRANAGYVIFLQRFSKETEEKILNRYKHNIVKITIS